MEAIIDFLLGRRIRSKDLDKTGFNASFIYQRPELVVKSTLNTEIEVADSSIQLLNAYTYKGYRVIIFSNLFSELYIYFC